MNNNAQIVNGTIKGKVLITAFIVFWVSVSFGFEKAANYYISQIEISQKQDTSSLSNEEMKNYLKIITNETNEIERRTNHIILFASIFNAIIFLCLGGVALLTFLKKSFPPPGIPVPWDTRVKVGADAIWAGFVLTIVSLVYAAILITPLLYGI